MSLIEHREGIEAGRLDMFVDGAFAFTLTLLVIGGDAVPNSTAKLMEVLGGVPAFAACFAQITMFWYGHVRWRRLCMGSDRTGRWLSLLLVFFALIFVYPLHMVFASVFNGLSPWFPSAFQAHGPADMRTLFVCYGLSFACMAGTLVLLFRHAARCAARDGSGTLEMRREALLWSIPVAVGMLSVATALLLPLSASGGWWGLPGFAYFLMILTWPVMNNFRRRHGVE
ncbi:TMEM175 family protein [Dyella agri]|uniref:DUF1211 domain-containing protein n=1 Tax=Dyella agri TaxID=1926869 RepID=A0ABW8KDT8_9GAMM